MKKYKLILQTLLVSFLSLFSCGIDPRKDNPGYIYIGETYKISRYREDKSVFEFYLTNEGFTFETIEDNALIKSKATFDPLQSFTMKESDIFAEVNNIKYDMDTGEGKIFTSSEYNIKENGYDIFEKEISSKITYTFCYIAPLIYEGKKFQNSAICYVFHSAFLVSTTWG